MAKYINFMCRNQYKSLVSCDTISSKYVISNRKQSTGRPHAPLRAHFFTSIVYDN